MINCLAPKLKIYSLFPNLLGGICSLSSLMTELQLCSLAFSDQRHVSLFRVGIGRRVASHHQPLSLHLGKLYPIPPNKKKTRQMLDSPLGCCGDFVAACRPNGCRLSKRSMWLLALPSLFRPWTWRSPCQLPVAVFLPQWTRSMATCSIRVITPTMPSFQYSSPMTGAS